LRTAGHQRVVLSAVPVFGLCGAKLVVQVGHCAVLCADSDEITLRRAILENERARWREDLRHLGLMGRMGGEGRRVIALRACVYTVSLMGSEISSLVW
jgi:hypothetical protein